MELGHHIQVHVSRRLIHIFELTMLSAVTFAMLLASGMFHASAAGLGARRISISDSGANEITTHGFMMNINTATSIGSIEFEYCTNSPVSGQPCTAPVGLDVSGAIMGPQTGETGFSIHANTTVNRIVITRAAAVTVPGTSTYQFGNVINPSNTNQTVYVRLSTFASSDGTGPWTDDGGVAFAILPALFVNAYVPPFLILCVAVTVTPNCASAVGTNINLGTLSSGAASAGTTMFGVATNDPGGYQAYGVGNTMTAGNNVIPALASQTPSAIGTSQFGINVRGNTVPTVGTDPTGLGTATLSTLYDDINLFRFQSGDLLADSNTATDFNIFTISYLVNVSPAQAPGRYSTTMTIIGTAAF